MIIRTDIAEFLSLAKQYPILDARSPGEYDHAHIPGAYSLPLFTDDERKVVGTAYKQESREHAIKNGLDFFGVKMRKMVEDAEAITAAHNKTQPSNCILIHCWRGGMRSAAVAWLLDLYGFKVYLLNGGYKVYRQWTLQQFEKALSFRMIGGYTGSGKTLVLQELHKRGKATLDLEGLANHKGSAFGGLGKDGQPTQEQFENDLALKLHELQIDVPVWIEDESRRIGDLNLPLQLWTNMRNSPVFFMEIPMEVRLEHIVDEYGKFRKEDLVTTIMRISKRLGGVGTRDAINHILEGNVKDSFRILLSYYDKFYLQGLYNRTNTTELINKVSSHTINPQTNCNLLLSAAALTN